MWKQRTSIVSRRSKADRRFGLFLIALVVIGLPSPAGADDCIALTGAKIYASKYGQYGFNLTLGSKPTNRAQGELFTYATSGERQSVWQAELVNVPSNLYVSTDGRTVVTIDTACRLGFDHSLVIYGAGGKVLNDFHLEQLLGAMEIQDHVKHSVSSRWWAEGAQFEFDTRVSELVVRLAWGRVIRVDLATGQVVR